MTDVVHSIALSVELLISLLLMFWGYRMMKEGWIRYRKLI